MHFSTIFSLGAIAASAAALPQSPGQGPTLKPWHVTDLEWDFAPGGTQDWFNVAGRADYGLPAFKATCTASNYVKTWQKCTGAGIPEGASVSHYWVYGTNDPKDYDAYILIKYHANGKTLTAQRGVNFASPGQTQHFPFYPSLKRKNLHAREAEAESEFEIEAEEAVEARDLPADYFWDIKDLTMGASSGGSWDELHISGNERMGMPAFAAHCEATVYQKTWVPCRGARNGDKVSHFWEETAEPKKMIVHFKYEARDKTFVARKEIVKPNLGKALDFMLYPRQK